MLQPNKPIYQKPQSQPQVAPKPVSREEIERKQIHHDDEWLFDHTGKKVTVVFTDNERLEGIISKVRKYTFTLQREQTSVMVYKIQTKYIVEVK